MRRRRLEAETSDKERERERQTERERDREERERETERERERKRERREAAHGKDNMLGIGRDRSGPGSPGHLAGRGENRSSINSPEILGLKRAWPKNS